MGVGRSPGDSKTAPAISELEGLCGQTAARIAGVDRSLWLDQQHVRLVIRLRAVLDAAWYHEQLTLLQLDVTVAQVDRQSPAEDKEEVVGVVVLVPDERPLDFHDLQLVVFEVANDSGFIRAREQRKLLGEIDLVVHVANLLAVACWSSQSSLRLEACRTQLSMALRASSGSSTSNCSLLVVPFDRRRRMAKALARTRERKRVVPALGASR